jgi:hypothetical protein
MDSTVPHWQWFSVRGVQLFEHLDCIVVGRVELKRLLVVGNRELPFAVVHISFGEAIVNIARLRIGFDVESEDANGFLELLASQINAVKRPIGPPRC